VQRAGFAWRSVTLAAYAAIAPSLPRLAFSRSFREDVADLGVMRNKFALFAISLVICAIRAFSQTEDSGGIPHQPKELVVVASPKEDLVAIARSPIPEPTIPDYSDADGTLLFIRGPNRGDHIIAQYFFGARFISKIVWSPDGQFLALCSESSGGHSPWNFKSYFWSRADRKFRSIDFATGPVVSDVFIFKAPHSLTVQIGGPDPSGGIDFEHPIPKIVDLDQLRHKVPELHPSPWP
jgi:hypothetical protein